MTANPIDYKINSTFLWFLEYLTEALLNTDVILEKYWQKQDSGKSIELPLLIKDSNFC